MTVTYHLSSHESLPYSLSLSYSERIFEHVCKVSWSHLGGVFLLTPLSPPMPTTLDSCLTRKSWKDGFQWSIFLVIAFPTKISITYASGSHSMFCMVQSNPENWLEHDAAHAVGLPVCWQLCVFGSHLC